jgi:hypothetical protein
MEVIGIFCGHFVYFVVIWYIFLQIDMLYQVQLWSFVTFCGHSVYFPQNLVW